MFWESGTWPHNCAGVSEELHELLGGDCLATCTAEELEREFLRRGEDDDEEVQQ